MVDKRDALLRAMDWGFVAAPAVVGALVVLGPSSPLSFPVAGEVVPRVVIAYVAAHSSLQWGAWFIDLSAVSQARTTGMPAASVTSA